MTDAYIFDAIRTARGKGKSTGALYEVKPISLLAANLKALSARNDFSTEKVDDLIVGCVTPIHGQGADIAKAALLYANWHHNVSGLQINRFCASGLEAVNLAAAKIQAGWADLMVAGGVESMSRIPMESDGGALLFDPDLTLKIGAIPQGIAADLIASIEGFRREELDEYALQSQMRAQYAIEKDYFKKSIIPIHDRNGLLVLDKDELIRTDTSLEKLAALQPSFQAIGENGFDALALQKYPFVEKVNHLHTAGNSSGIVDGAALVLLGNKAVGKSFGLKARARIRAAATASSNPTLMLGGATHASQKALARAKMKAEDIDLWEINEAFASVVLKFQRDFNLDNDKLNVNGGAIAMGHPLGATGSMLLGTLLDELERRDLRTGLVTLCAGGGMGVSTIIERI